MLAEPTLAESTWFRSQSRLRSTWSSNTGSFSGRPTAAVHFDSGQAGWLAGWLERWTSLRRALMKIVQWPSRLSSKRGTDSKLQGPCKTPLTEDELVRRLDGGYDGGSLDSHTDGARVALADTTTARVTDRPTDRPSVHPNVGLTDEASPTHVLELVIYAQFGASLSYNSIN